MIRLFPLALLLAAGAAEAGKRPTPPDTVEDALAFASTDRSRAVQLLEEAIAQSPGSATVGQLMVHAGEQRRLLGDTAKSREWFSRVVSRGLVGPDLEAARLGLTLLDVGERLDGKTLSALRAAPERDVLATQNAERFLLLTVDAAKRDEAKDVSTYGKKAQAYAREDASVAERVESTLAALASSESPGQVDMGGGDPTVKAEEAYLAGDLEAARTQAQRALNSTTGDDRARMEGLLRTLDAGPANRDVIAVLLPLSGKFEAAGKQVQDALDFGYANSSRRLVFIDSGATPESAVAALEQAVLTERAIAVIGPLLTDETDAVVAKAEELHVPLVSLSQAYEDTSGHTWSFQGMYTRTDQVEALLDYAMGPERQMKNFAIFAPNNVFGTNAAATFRKAVEARGGTITTEATYSAEETNLMQYAKKLGNREGDLAALRRQAEANGGNPDTVVLPPKLDFDGIFLPENAQRTPLACAALAFEEFPMGDFTPTRGMKKIPLLGLSGWNTQSLVAAGNEYTRSSIFTDVFSPIVAGDADPFVAAYKAEVGHTPTALEAAAVDVGKLVSAAADSPASSRGAFRQALLDATVADPVTGATRFDPATLRPNRKMMILTITRSTIDDLGSVMLD